MTTFKICRPEPEVPLSRWAVGGDTGSLYVKCKEGWLVVIGRGYFANREGDVMPKLPREEILPAGVKIEIIA